MSLDHVEGAFLAVTGVCKSYGDLVILDDIDLQVESGELCTVVGPSGCGKSTLLRQILGAEEPDSGLITIDGKVVDVPDPRRGIVFQKYSLYPHLTVLENTMIGPRMMAGWMPDSNQLSDIRDRSMEMLSRVRLHGHEAKYPHELSGGMRQRVAIAQSLVMEPSILLMDEPFGALDPDTREELQLFLLEQWERMGMTVFFVTHDLEEAAYLGTRLLALSKYYTDGRPKNDPGKGAKIVCDFSLERAVSSVDIKRDARFRDLITQIRNDAFDPDILQHVREFNLDHLSASITQPQADPS